MSERTSTRPNRTVPLRKGVALLATAAVALAGCNTKIGSDGKASAARGAATSGTLENCDKQIPVADTSTPKSKLPQRTFSFDAAKNRYTGDLGPSAVPQKARAAVLQVVNVATDTIASAIAVEESDGDVFALAAAKDFKVGESLESVGGDIQLINAKSKADKIKSGCITGNVAVFHLVTTSGFVKIGSNAKGGEFVGIVTNQEQSDGSQRIAGKPAVYTGVAVTKNVVLDGIDTDNFDDPSKPTQVMDGNDAARGGGAVGMQSGDLEGLIVSADKDATSHAQLKTKFNVISRSTGDGSGLSVVDIVPASALRDAVADELAYEKNLG